MLWGVKRLVLFGFDMQPAAGKNHWFGDHPPRLQRQSPFTQWQSKYRKVAADLRQLGVEVFNCSPLTALDCFEKVDADEAERLLFDPAGTGV